ncbi:MAG: hypothetical protein ACRDM1_14830 [Gaiellaceae bacterium]
MRRRLIGAAAVLAASCSAAGAAAGPAASPARLMSSALAAAHAQRSVHYVTTATIRGVRIGIVGDAGVDRGRQRITYRQTGGAGRVTVIVVANTAYIHGDAFTLVHYMGLPAALAAARAGKWILVPHTSSAFKTVAAAARLGSAVDELKMPLPLESAGTATVRGQRATGIRSRFSRFGYDVTETLYVRAAGSPLPVEQVGHGANIAFSDVFGDWNEPVDVAAPAGAVPLP